METKCLNERYARQINIDGFGVQCQKKLSESKVLIIGCGALGSMVAMQLAGAGIGEITIADFDKIDISNLQRQFFFKSEEAGNSKVKTLAKRMEELNPEIKINIIEKLITLSTGEPLFKDTDFIIDATDNPSSKLMTDELSEKLGKPCCIGGVTEYRGQLSTFLPEDEIRYTDIFEINRNIGFLPCSLAGVMGPAASVCASFQSIEAIKYLTGKGELLTQKLLSFDLYNNKFNVFSLV